MKAKVIQEFPGRPDKETKTRMIAVGEMIDGELAEVAVREKWAKAVRGEPKSAEKSEQQDQKTDELEGIEKTADGSVSTEDRAAEETADEAAQRDEQKAGE